MSSKDSFIKVKYWYLNLSHSEALTFRKVLSKKKISNIV